MNITEAVYPSIAYFRLPADVAQYALTGDESLISQADKDQLQALRDAKSFGAATTTRNASTNLVGFATVEVGFLTTDTIEACRAPAPNKPAAVNVQLLREQLLQNISHCIQLGEIIEARELIRNARYFERAINAELLSDISMRDIEQAILERDIVK